jgi:uncharacterized protein (DUF1330 family)
MIAYAVVTREKTRDASELNRYKQLAPRSFKEYPATIRAIHGRTEVLEGSAAEDIVILEFPTYEDAKAWYQSSTYQAASKHRHQGGDYRFILTKVLQRIEWPLRIYFRRMIPRPGTVSYC